MDFVGGVNRRPCIVSPPSEHRLLQWFNGKTCEPATRDIQSDARTFKLRNRTTSGPPVSVDKKLPSHTSRSHCSVRSYQGNSTDSGVRKVLFYKRPHVSVNVLD